MLRGEPSERRKEGARNEQKQTVAAVVVVSIECVRFVPSPSLWKNHITGVLVCPLDEQSPKSLVNSGKKAHPNSLCTSKFVCDSEFCNCFSIQPVHGTVRFYTFFRAVILVYSELVVREVRAKFSLFSFGVSVGAEFVITECREWWIKWNRSDFDVFRRCAVRKIIDGINLQMGFIFLLKGIEIGFQVIFDTPFGLNFHYLGFV